MVYFCGATNWLDVYNELLAKLTTKMINSQDVCVWVAPTMHQAKNGFIYLRDKCNDIKHVNTHAMELTLYNGAIIRFRPATTYLRGIYPDYLIIENAAQIPAEIYTMILDPTIVIMQNAQRSA